MFGDSEKAETRERGLTTHCRRDPRNAKRIGRTVRDLVCTGAQGVGKKAVWCGVSLDVAP